MSDMSDLAWRLADKIEIYEKENAQLKARISELEAIKADRADRAEDAAELAHAWESTQKPIDEIANEYLALLVHVDELERSTKSVLAPNKTVDYPANIELNEGYLPPPAFGKVLFLWYKEKASMLYEAFRKE